MRITDALTELAEDRALRADLAADRRRRSHPAAYLLAAHGLNAPVRRADAHGVDPRAFLHAARWLARKFGERNRAAGQFGGWDAVGHWGVSAADVRRAWFLSGCRPSRKFFLLLTDAPASVTTGMFRLARKGDTTLDLLRLRRGLRRLQAFRQQYAAPAQGRWSRLALMALGRLSAPLANALLREVPEEMPAPIRVRALPWAAVARVQAMLAADHSGRVRVALTGDRGALVLAGLRDTLPPVRQGGIGEWEAEQLAVFLAPAYPRVPLVLAKRIALGETPVQITGGELTRREAHDWLASGARLPAGEWIAERLMRAAGIEPTQGWLPRERRVAEWLIALTKRDGIEAVDAALQREREGGYLADGRHELWRAADLLDAVVGADIASLSDGITAVMTRVRARMDEQKRADLLANRRQIVVRKGWHATLPRGVRLLATPADLIAEGDAMRHCVAGYTAAVEDGRCAILAVRSRHGRSTVEVSPDGARIIQHRGPGNGDPPRRHRQLIAAFTARLSRRG